MDYDVIDVKTPDHLHLQLTFRDGVSGDVFIKDSFLTGVFFDLKNPAIFSTVTCKDGFVAWENDVDLAPEVLHNQLKLSKVVELV